MERLIHPKVKDMYLISPSGHVCAEDLDEQHSFWATYHATNGYDFIRLLNVNGDISLFPIDEIIGYTFIPIPEDLIDKPKIINHINGDTRDISLDNLEWIEDIEEWRICTYPGVKPNTYEISSWGNIRNKNLNKCINGEIDKSGYIRLGLRSDRPNDRMHQVLHRLVAFQFNNLELKYTVNHIDCDKLNNRPKNLEGVSNIDNIRHAMLTGRRQYGDKHSNASLLNSDVKIICESLIKTHGDLDETLNIVTGMGIITSRENIRQIRNKQTWKFISDEYFSKDSMREKLYKSEVHDICKLLIKTNFNVKETTKLFNIQHDYEVSERSVANICYKQRWFDISRLYF